MNENTRLVIASDFSGFHLKEAVKKHLISLGYAPSDIGQLAEDENLLYYEAASRLAKAIQRKEFDRGIVFCGTGAGVSLIVNKFRGIYCVPCESIFTAEKTSLINNANVLAMGERVVSFGMGGEMAEKWLQGNWCEGFEPQRRQNNEKGFAVLQEIEAESFRPIDSIS